MKTIREIRPGAHAVEIDGKRVGSLHQNPANKDRDPLRWVYWPAGAAPWPPFRSFDEAREAILSD